MTVRYRKNARTEFVKPVIYSKKFWLVVATLSFISHNFINHTITKYALLLTAATIYSIIVLGFVIRVKDTKHLKRVFQEYRIEERIKKALIATMTVNQHIGTAFIDVPKVRVSLKNPVLPQVSIERLAGMNDIEQIAPNINVAFIGSYANFGVTSAFENDNGLDFMLCLEDVSTDKTFTPRTENELHVEPYELILQEGLKVNLSKSPHLGILGRSGGGKTSTLYSVILQLLSTGVDIRFGDGKMELSSLAEFYPKEKIVSDVDDILNMLENVTDEITTRQKIVAEAVNKYRKIGLTGYHINLQPLVVIIDELGSIVAGMTTKQKNQLFAYLSQLAQKGRSVSAFLIIANQFANVDVLPNNIRSQLSTRILLGTANKELQRMVFNDATLLKTGNVKPFKGYYVVEGQNSQPLAFHVPNLHAHELNTLDCFEAAYQYGLKHFSHLYWGGYGYNEDLIRES